MGVSSGSKSSGSNTTLNIPLIQGVKQVREVNYQITQSNTLHGDSQSWADLPLVQGVKPVSDFSPCKHGPRSPFTQHKPQIKFCTMQASLLKSEIATSIKYLFRRPT